MDAIRGQRFTTSTSVVSAQSISAYIACTTSAKNMKAAIFDSSGNLISSTTEKSVPTGTTWQTFNFASPPILTASTQYVLVVWSSSGSGTADLRYSSTIGGLAVMQPKHTGLGQHLKVLQRAPINIQSTAIALAHSTLKLQSTLATEIH